MATETTTTAAETTTSRLPTAAAAAAARGRRPPAAVVFATARPGHGGPDAADGGVRVRGQGRGGGVAQAAHPERSAPLHP